MATWKQKREFDKHPCHVVGCDRRSLNKIAWRTTLPGEEHRGRRFCVSFCATHDRLSVDDQAALKIDVDKVLKQRSWR